MRMALRRMLPAATMLVLLTACDAGGSTAVASPTPPPASAAPRPTPTVTPTATPSPGLQITGSFKATVPAPTVVGCGGGAIALDFTVSGVSWRILIDQATVIAPRSDAATAQVTMFRHVHAANENVEASPDPSGPTMYSTTGQYQSLDGGKGGILDLRLAGFAPAGGPGATPAPTPAVQVSGSWHC
jgi:hypothetical protein